MRLPQSAYRDNPHTISLTEPPGLKPRVIDTLREFEEKFSINILLFDAKTAQAYQNTTVGSKEFKIHLLEMIAIACHNIAVLIYKEIKGSNIPTERIWYQPPPIISSLPPRLDGRPDEPETFPPRLVLPTDFYHPFYQAMEQYPEGVADVVGYRAELRIFGGVVVFDRGESGDECKEALIHPAKRRMIYQLHDHQIDEFVKFESVKRDGDVNHSLNLDSVRADTAVRDDEILGSPLPFQNERYHRRVDERDAFNQHIFRNRYERKWATRAPLTYRRMGADEPELEDVMERYRTTGKFE
ncbi:uncharacterized protein BDZ99DRAFT_526762 [Mytilinidion resinicola]|uniref:Uncharacterized protein n=1 Tax=Mytilinidion resinicola TaxID=574789 RepID=A0A6A6Y457_9PEZI|nr:uncharacterized protein BDZ99DRAFT_526762 [Mytilinidion resinicola]KAF2803409.1 hypothetical protein BDZ99DRAFT_526762 [Mytilinidion resinicola]